MSNGQFIQDFVSSQAQTDHDHDVPMEDSKILEEDIEEELMDNKSSDIDINNNTLEDCQRWSCNLSHK